MSSHIAVKRQQEPPQIKSHDGWRKIISRKRRRKEIEMCILDIFLSFTYFKSHTVSIVAVHYVPVVVAFVDVVPENKEQQE